MPQRSDAVLRIGRRYLWNTYAVSVNATRSVARGLPYLVGVTVDHGRVGGEVGITGRLRRASRGPDCRCYSAARRAVDCVSVTVAAPAIVVAGDAAVISREC
jgi:hypothetical protein